jgi:membrane protein YdbS with pleckstrin-like domain
MAMRQQPSGIRTPVAVSKYLLPTEEQMAYTRMHPAVLLVPSVQALAGLLVAAALTAVVLHGNALLVYIVWLGFLVLLVRLAWKVINWWVDYFVVTSQRLVLSTGLLTRRIAMMPLTKVTDMSFYRTFPGRLLGYGELRVESAGQVQGIERVPYIPYPEDLYLLVCGMIFPSSASDEDEEDRSPVPDEL